MEPSTTEPTEPDVEAAPEQDGDAGRLGRLQRLHARLHQNRVTSLATKIVVTVIGTVVLLAGVVMMVTPGPGIVGIILGLAILATEWDWADHWMKQTKARAQAAAERARDMDPKVQRRRLLLVTLGLLLLVGAATGYVVSNGWPGWSLDAWEWVRGWVGWLPDLPGS